MTPFRRRPRQASQPAVVMELEETTIDLAPNEYEVVSGMFPSAERETQPPPDEPMELSLADCQVVADAPPQSETRPRQSSFARILDAELERSFSGPARASLPVPASAPPESRRWDLRAKPLPATAVVTVSTKTPRRTRPLLALVTLLVAAGSVFVLFRVEPPAGRLHHALEVVTSFVAR